MNESTRNTLLALGALMVIAGAAIAISLRRRPPVLINQSCEIQGLGNTSDLVRNAQIALNALIRVGALQADPLDTDGIFGPQTQATVMAFQTQEGIIADGVLGPETYERLHQRLQEHGGAFVCP